MGILYLAECAGQNAEFWRLPGIGLYAVKTLSADLAAICGKNKSSRGQVMKSVWAYSDQMNESDFRVLFWTHDPNE